MQFRPGHLVKILYDRLEGFQGPFPQRLPKKPPNTLGKFILHYARPFLPLIIASIVLTTVIALIEVYLFSFVGELVDWLDTADRSTFWSDYKIKLITLSILVLLILPGLKFISESITNQGLLGNFAMHTRWETHRYLLRQSVAFFQNDFAGRLAAKMMQTSLGVRDSIIKITEILLYVVVYFFGALIIFASSDIRLSFPLVGWLVVYIAILYYFIPRLRNISMEQAEARSVVTGQIVDSYSNITTVKMFTHTEFEDAYAKQGMEVFLDSVYRQMRMSTNLSAWLTAINCLLLFSVAFSAIWLWSFNAITTGAIAFSLTLVLRLQGMSQWIIWEVWALFENIGVVEDGINTISQEIAITDKPDAKDLAVSQGAIHYKNVHFNYNITESKEKVVKDFCLEVQGGEKIGIVGRSGAGKSTVVSLLLRFYDLEQGQITIDGQDISTVTQESLRSKIAMVNQDTSLLHRSVYDNICYGNKNISIAQVVTAAKQAKAHDFITTLQDQNGNTGYDTRVGERGVKLSGGQRQRITIARVFLKNAPILILDEATSALDSGVEQAIQDSLYTLMQGKTVIAIAHRLSTIANMDRLIIMDDGNIVESGSHQQLLENAGLYKELWIHQSGGFIAHKETG